MSKFIRQLSQRKEKVLTWLIDSWRPTKAWGKLTMPLHSVQDTLGLLGTVCGVARQVEIACEMVLPDCPIVESILEEHSTAVIRNMTIRVGRGSVRTMIIDEVGRADGIADA